MKLGENIHLKSTRYMLLLRISVGLDQNCGFFTNGQVLSHSTFFFRSPSTLGSKSWMGNCPSSSCAPAWCASSLILKLIFTYLHMPHSAVIELKRVDPHSVVSDSKISNFAPLLRCLETVINSTHKSKILTQALLQTAGYFIVNK